jgi:hypothetical protein
MAVRKSVDSDPEINAISIVYDALRALNPDAQRRVLEYVEGKLGLRLLRSEGETYQALEGEDLPSAASTQQTETEDSGASEGISPVALKWMKRSGLAASSLSALFSLGVDEIDLVAKKVPGDNKKDRMHSVLLLKGIAAYLSSGVARVTHDQLKEACLHYDAFDTNFARNLKSFSSEVAGTKESGYTLTARGLTNATEIIQVIVKAAAGAK